MGKRIELASERTGRRSIMNKVVIVLVSLMGLPTVYAQAPRRESSQVRFGRVKKEMAPEYVAFSRVRTSPKSYGSESYYAQMLIHRAHVVMLIEQNILTKEEGATILRGLQSVETMADENEALRAYMATEKALIENIGSVGGKMHIGRSRNDLGLTQSRIYYRDQINELIDAVIEFQKALTKKAEENLDTVMPGYTHRRQAQPITLAHYLMAHVQAAGRSVERLEDVYRRTNQNTLGAAALAGTGWPLDRARTMELLGFDGMVENTEDCVASFDFIGELASAIAIHMTNLSRLAADLKVWSSDEWATIDLDESYTGTSSIMPQKKNPSVAEAVNLSSSECLGALVTTMSSLNGIEYGNSGERARLQPDIVSLTIASTNVMSGFTATIQPMKQRMLLLASQGFSTMTELADTLVRVANISFREAHEIVAQTVLRAIDEGKTADQITAEMVHESAIEVMGEKLNIADEDLLAAIDPVENVERRSLIGGPAPKEVQRMIESRWETIRNQEDRLQARLGDLESAREKLERAEAAILQSVKGEIEY
jgi:argininosuccinate lyase